MPDTMQPSDVCYPEGKACHPERSEGSGWLVSDLHCLLRDTRSRSFASLRMTDLRTRRRFALRITAAFLLSTLLASAAMAQVGHPPSASPYRDIRAGHTITVMGGYLTGDGGDLNIGPHDGPSAGLRYDIRTSRTIQFGLGVFYGDLQRFIVNPFVTLANRRTGPVSQSVTFADLHLQFNMTGGKSWNRIAPFLATSAGLAFASSTPADTSQYDFGNEFYIAPAFGFRFFLTERLHLRAEAKFIFWKLDYPTTFQQEPVEEPGTPGNSNAVILGGNLSDWATTPWLQAGLGYSISP